MSGNMLMIMGTGVANLSPTLLLLAACIIYATRWKSATSFCMLAGGFIVIAIQATRKAATNEE